MQFDYFGDAAENYQQRLDGIYERQRRQDEILEQNMPCRDPLVDYYQRRIFFGVRIKAGRTRRGVESVGWIFN